MIWRALLRVAQRGPTRTALFLSAAGWILTAWLLGANRAQHGAVHMAARAHLGLAPGLATFGAPLDFVALWLAMILAMAPPLLIREVAQLWRGSRRRLRHFLIAWFVVGYVLCWMLAGVVLRLVCERFSASVPVIAITTLIVVLWHCSPLHQRAINACHRAQPVCAFGARAHWDALRYGASIGSYCIATCAADMLLVLLLSGHHLVAMAFTASLATLERYLPPRRPRWRLPVLRPSSPEWSSVSVTIPRGEMANVNNMVR